MTKTFMETEFYEVTKQAVEQNLSLSSGIKGQGSNKYLPCPPACNRNKKAKDQCFSYDTETGLYQCHSGTCGLPDSKGNAHTLGKALNIEIQTNGKQSGKRSPVSNYQNVWYYKNKDGSFHSFVGRKADPQGGKKYHTYYWIDGEWVFSSDVKGNPPEKILYNLNLFKSADVIFIVEGEKCADALQSILPSRMVATTNLGGAKKWHDSYTESLKGKTLVVIPDNDQPGLDHANTILHALRNESVFLINPSDLEISEEGEDIADVISKGLLWKNGLEKVYNKAVKESKKQFSLFGELSPEEKEKKGQLLVRSSEMGSRDRFISMFGQNVLFVPQRGKNGTWYFWDGVIWKESREGEVFQKIESVKDIVWKEILESKDTVETQALLGHWANLQKGSQLRQLRVSISESAEVITPIEKLDSYHNIVSFQNFYYDLDSHNPILPDPQYKLTKSLHCEFIEDADCPEFKAFLERSQPDPEVRELIQKIAGTFLYGKNYFEKVFFFFGEQGANGKSLFVEIMFKLLGEFAKRGGSSLINEREKPSMDELAILRGSRLVTTPEIAKGSVLRSPMVKDLTGGEEVKGEFKFQDSFNFRPGFSLLMVGNYKPTLDPTDEGIKRRLILIPWEQTFHPGGPGFIPRDKLMEAMEKELPGIANWMIEGLKQLQKDQWHFKEPEIIRKLIEEYFASEDKFEFEDFIDDCLEKDDAVITARNFKAIYQVYQAHTREGGGFPLQKKNFKNELSRRGIKFFKENHKVRGILGYRIKEEWQNRISGDEL